MFDDVEKDYNAGTALGEALVEECRRQDVATCPALGAVLAVVFKELIEDAPTPHAIMGVVAMSISVALNTLAQEEHDGSPLH